MPPEDEFTGGYDADLAAVALHHNRRENRIRKRSEEWKKVLREGKPDRPKKAVPVKQNEYNSKAEALEALRVAVKQQKKKENAEEEDDAGHNRASKHWNARDLRAERLRARTDNVIEGKREVKLRSDDDAMFERRERMRRIQEQQEESRKKRMEMEEEERKKKEEELRPRHSPKNSPKRSPKKKKPATPSPDREKEAIDRLNAQKRRRQQLEKAAAAARAARPHMDEPPRILPKSPDKTGNWKASDKDGSEEWLENLFDGFFLFSCCSSPPERSESSNSLALSYDEALVPRSLLSTLGDETKVPGSPRSNKAGENMVPGSPRSTKSNGSGAPGSPRSTTADENKAPGSPRSSKSNGSKVPGSPRSTKSDDNVRSSRSSPVDVDEVPLSPQSSFGDGYDLDDDDDDDLVRNPQSTMAEF